MNENDLQRQVIFLSKWILGLSIVCAVMWLFGMFELWRFFGKTARILHNIGFSGSDFTKPIVVMASGLGYIIGCIFFFNGIRFKNNNISLIRNFIAGSIFVSLFSIISACCGVNTFDLFDIERFFKAKQHFAFPIAATFVTGCFVALMSIINIIMCSKLAALKEDKPNYASYRFDAKHK